MTIRFWYLGRAGVSAGSLSHSSLLGLSNDDHQNYPFVTRAFGPPSTTPSREGLIYIDLTKTNASLDIEKGEIQLKQSGTSLIPETPIGNLMDSWSFDSSVANYNNGIVFDGTY